MIQLTDKDTGAALGTISEQQLQYLIDQLEEESSEDQDYYINETTLDLFEQRGADKALVSLLRSALKGRTEMEIRWSRR
jgi:processive 1,2-diacylglycerol beta-glucosyltransferase